MNKTNDERSDSYLLNSLKRGLSSQRYEIKPPRVTHLFNTEKKQFRNGYEDHAPFANQDIEFNTLRPYRQQKPKGSFSWNSLN